MKLQLNSLLRKFRSKSATPVPAPLPEKIEATPESERGRSGPWKWIVVLVLGTAIAGVRLYYPDLMEEATEFASGLWPPDILLVSRPIVEGTATPVAANRPGPTVEITLTAELVPTPTTTLEADPPSMAGPKAQPESSSIEASEGGLASAAEIAVGALMVGGPRGGYVTMWTYPGINGGHLVVHRYETGTAFEIVEPDRTIGEYPVNLGGESWLRVQAQDGLVGWVKSTELETSKTSVSQ